MEEQEQPTNNFYHIELIVVNINKASRGKNVNRVNYSKDLLVKLVMHQLQGNQIIAQSHEMIRTQTIQNTIKCFNGVLSLSIDGDQDDVNWKLMVYGRQSTVLDNKRMDFSQSQSSGKKQFKRIGQCQINPMIYVDVFNESQKIKFQQNIQISNHISIDYEVFIHRSRQFLDEFVRIDQLKQPVEIVDTAFKKREGSKKIRYVQFIQNREASINSSDFSLAKKPQITSLVKSGQKYVPNKRLSFGNNIAERKGRQYHLQRKIKALPQKQKSLQVSMKSQYQQSKKVNRSQLKQSKSQMKNDRTQIRGKIPWQGLILMTMLILIACYMMFPVRKVRR